MEPYNLQWTVPLHISHPLLLIHVIYFRGYFINSKKYNIDTRLSRVCKAALPVSMDTMIWCNGIPPPLFRLRRNKPILTKLFIGMDSAKITQRCVILTVTITEIKTPIKALEMLIMSILMS